MGERNIRNEGSQSEQEKREEREKGKLWRGLRIRREWGVGGVFIRLYRNGFYNGEKQERKNPQRNSRIRWEIDRYVRWLETHVPNIRSVNWWVLGIICFIIILVSLWLLLRKDGV